jgi:hypothetical protein
MLYLPRSRAHATDCPRCVLAADLAGRLGHRVLVVEDNPDVGEFSTNS